jgi:hypothetical protein
MDSRLQRQMIGLARRLRQRPWVDLALMILWIAVLSYRFANGLVHVALFLALGVMTVRWIVRNWRPRPLEGHCLTCGYDLRATPQCCPECGTVPGPTGTP